MNAHDHNKYYGEKWANEAAKRDAKICIMLSSTGDGKLLCAAADGIPPTELIKLLRAAADSIAVASGLQIQVRPN